MKASHMEKETRVTLKNLALVVLGTLLLAFGSAVFLLPKELVTCGVTGIVILIIHILGEEVISAEVLIALLTWALFFLGLFTLGWEFAIKTLVSTLVYPPAISLFLYLSSASSLGGAFHLACAGEPSLALITGALFGGLFVGAGCALTCLGGGSTGGMDVLALLLCRLFPRRRSSAAIFYFDALTIAAGIFVLRDLPLCLLGIISAFVSATVIDRIFVGRGGGYSAFIVTERADRLTRAVIEELSRTVTSVSAFGGYSVKQKTVLLLSLDAREYPRFCELLRREDPDAFVTVHRAHEIGGHGWN